MIYHLNKETTEIKREAININHAGTTGKHQAVLGNQEVGPDSQLYCPAPPLPLSHAAARPH